MFFRPATQGDLAGFPIMTCQEDSESLAETTAALSCQSRCNVQEVKGRRLRQALQAETQDAIKNKVCKRVWRHVSGSDEAHAQAIPLAFAQFARGACANSGPTKVAMAMAQAKQVFQKNAHHFSGPEGHSDLISGFAHPDQTPVPVYVTCCGRRTPSVASVSFTCAGMTIRARQDQVSASCIEDHREGLGRRAHHNSAVICALVVDGIFHDMDLLLRSLQVNSDMPLADVWLHPDGLGCRRRSRRIAVSASVRVEKLCITCQSAQLGFADCKAVLCCARKVSYVAWHLSLRREVMKTQQ
mmetsp:Transcript_21001/g.49251  ORF Transcript_21001/g.49251 Transcript_21001/m.49251 type:complete len:299 (+) Transcript_21001:707-1603(+)